MLGYTGRPEQKRPDPDKLHGRLCHQKVAGMKGIKATSKNTKSHAEHIRNSAEELQRSRKPPYWKSVPRLPRNMIKALISIRHFQSDGGDSDPDESQHRRLQANFSLSYSKNIGINMAYMGMTSMNRAALETKPGLLRAKGMRMTRKAKDLQAADWSHQSG